MRHRREGQTVGSRLGIRIRASIAAVAAMVLVLAVLFVVLVLQTQDLDRGFTAFETARASIAMNQALDAGLDPDVVTRDVPDHVVVLIDTDEGEYYRYGDDQAIRALAEIEVVTHEIRTEHLDGRAVILFDAPCPIPHDSDCVFRLATPERSRMSFVGEVWGDYWLALVPILVLTALVVPFLVGRSLRSIGRLASEVEDISNTETRHQLPLPASNDEILQLTETLNRLLARLHETTMAQRRFIADASHELRSPVAAIGVTTEMANRFPERRASDTTWERLTAESARLNRVVDQLLVVASRDQGPAATGAAEPVDLEAVVRSQIPVDTKVEVSIERSGEPFAITTITSAEIMLSNLINNAIRHARRRVSIRIEPVNSETIAVVVSDDGGGVSPAHHDLVFEPFTRLDSARSRHTGGTGLGLTIARSTARADGGDIRFDPRRRSTIICTLPRPAADFCLPTG